MGKLKKGRLKEIVGELQNASKMHLAQSKEIEKHIEDMKSPAQKRSVEDGAGLTQAEVDKYKSENPGTSSFAVASYSCTIQISIFLFLKIIRCSILQIMIII